MEKACDTKQTKNHNLQNAKRRRLIVILILIIIWIGIALNEYKSGKSIPVADRSLKILANTHFELETQKTTANLFKRKKLETKTGLSQRNYLTIIEGEDIISNQKVWAIRLKPKYNKKHWPWRQLWVNKNTGELVALRDWTSRNQIKRIIKTGKSSHQLQKSSQSFSFSQYEKLGFSNSSKNSYLPIGFFRLCTLTCANNNITCHIFSNGVSHISIMTAPSKTNFNINSNVRPNVIYDWGKGLIILKKYSGGYAIIIADLPNQEINKIADSIE